MPDDPELLHVDGKVLDTDDLTYAERIAIRRVVEKEVWALTNPGETFDWEEVTSDHIMPATIAVLMRRDDADYTIKQAVECKPERVFTAPPTKASPKRSSSRPKASAASGSQS